jgi:hypothetical protein
LDYSFQAPARQVIVRSAEPSFEHGEVSKGERMPDRMEGLPITPPQVPWVDIEAARYITTVRIGPAHPAGR